MKLSYKDNAYYKTKINLKKKNFFSVEIFSYGFWFNFFLLVYEYEMSNLNSNGNLLIYADFNTFSTILTKKYSLF